MNMVTVETQGLTTNLLRERSELERIALEWQELFNQSPGATAFQNPEWVLTWIETFSPRELLIIELRDAGKLVGLAPLLIYPRAEESVLAFAGGGVSDYLDIIAEPGREECVIKAILRAIGAEPRWTTLDLTDLPGNSALLNFPAFREYTREHDHCPVLDLPTKKEDLLQCFSKRQRANLRNSRSRLQRTGGSRVEVATAETLPEFLDDLFRLHTARWSSAGESGVLSDAQVRQFHKACAPQLFARGILHLYRLRVGHDTAAVIYALVRGQTLYCYLQGLDPAFASTSPGTQLMFAALENAVDLGVCRFDFLRGQEAYKQHWRPHVERTYRIEVPRSALLSLQSGA